MLNQFLEYRELTITKRTQHYLSRTNNRLEIVKGLINALKNLRSVIDMIEKAKDATEAKSKLIDKLQITEKQAEAVLSMPLRRLTSLEQNSLHHEANNLETEKKVT